MAADLEARLEKLEAQVAAQAQELAGFRAKEAILDVIALFARGADEHCNPDILALLFSDEAVFDIGDFGRIEGGGKAIAAQMHANNAKGFYWTLHYLVSPRIDVADDGQSAKADYYLWEPAAMHPDNGSRAFAIGGRYHADLICTEGRWQFRYLALSIELLSRRNPWGDVPKGFDALLED